MASMSSSTYYTGPSFSTGAHTSSALPSDPIASFFKSWALPLSSKTQTHLFQTYTLLGVTLFCSAAGALAHLNYNIGGMLTHLASFALIVVISMDRGRILLPSDYFLGQSRRVWLLLAFGFFQGASLGPLIDLALYVDPAIITTAFIVTANLFLCLSATSLYAQRKAFFALASILSTSVSTLLMISLISLFFPTVFLLTIQIYLGLFVFLGYVLFDTQMIVERIESGLISSVGDEYVDSALTLFLDFVGIFVRILIILIKNSANRDERKRERRSR